MTYEERISQLEEENRSLRTRAQNAENRLARLEQFMQSGQQPQKNRADSSTSAAARRHQYQLLFDNSDNTTINVCKFVINMYMDIYIYRNQFLFCL